MRSCFIVFQNFWRFQVYHLSWIIAKITPNRASCKGSGYNNARKAKSFHFYIVMVLLFWLCSLAKKSWKRKDDGFEKVFPELSNDREDLGKNQRTALHCLPIPRAVWRDADVYSGPVTEGDRVPIASSVSGHLCSVSQTVVEMLPN